MFSVQEKYKFWSKSNKNAIVLCNQYRVLELKTHKEVRTISNIITRMISEYVADQHTCIGLLMNHNVYIPSIILSLQNLKHAFVFVTPKSLSKTLTDLRLQWILSLGDTKEIRLFKQLHQLNLNEKNNLILWHRSSSVFTDINYMDIFCVVQTSGSTGEYKTIRVSNACIKQNASNLRLMFEISSNDVIYWGTPLTFDPSLVELLLALQSGACLVIVPYNVSVNPNTLYQALFSVEQVTFLQMVPSIFLRWDESQIQNILQSSQLKNLAFGGENFPKDILRFNRSDNLTIYNLYGISEVSCWATVHEIKDETCDDDIPIGTCLTATSLEVRDEQGKVVDVGKGEIFIGSSSRICYVNDEREKDGTVFRKTGDIAEVNEKGIFLIGRKNRIIKRFGHRVNLSRLEELIFKGTGLQSKCVWLKENNKILTFILIKNFEKHIKYKTMDKLRVKLMNILPEESFPDLIDIVENFPLTSHGKIDEKALVKLYATPNTTVKSGVDVFSQLWCKYFGVGTENLGQLKTCKFFEMGGNSISAIQLLSEFKELMDCDYPQELVKMIFENSLQDCLNCLQTSKSLRKRSLRITENKSKKEKTTHELKVIWSSDLKACVDTSPAVFEKDGSVYVSVGSFSHIFTVFNENGETMLRTVLPDSIEGTPSIAPCGNFILVGCSNGKMYCIDFSQKKIIWEYGTGGKIKSSPCFCRNQTAAAFGSYDKKVHCVSLEAGLVLWEILLDGSIASNPVYDEPNKKIFIASTSGMCACLDETTGELLWKYNAGGPIFGTPCFVDNNNSIVFPAVQGVLHCLRSRTGEKLWTFQADGHIFSSVILYRDLLLFGCHDKNVYVTKVSPLNCDLVSKVGLDSEISTTPFACNISGNEMVIAACNSGLINVVDLRTFSVWGSVKLPGEVFSSPCVYKDRIYVGCRDNNLYCIAIDMQKK